MDNETNNEIDLSNFAIDDLMKSTYSKIVDWHNSDGSAPGLKWLSIELIEDICGAAFNHLGIPYTPTVKVDKALKEEAMKNYNMSNEVQKTVEEMTDEELFIEIQKRKSKDKL